MSLSKTLHPHCLVMVKSRQPSQNECKIVDRDVKPQTNKTKSIWLFMRMFISLQLIPMPVLYGVFLYMGVSSLKGMQLVNRILIIFMPIKYQPDYIFLRHVRTRRVHFFTIIQVMIFSFTVKPVLSNHSKEDKK